MVQFLVSLFRQKSSYTNDFINDLSACGTDKHVNYLQSLFMQAKKVVIAIGLPLAKVVQIFLFEIKIYIRFKRSSFNRSC